MGTEPAPGSDLASCGVAVNPLSQTGAANSRYPVHFRRVQERATKVSHGNTAAHASAGGDRHLGKICAAIAGDEARHEKAYIKIVDELFRLCARSPGLVHPPVPTHAC